MVRTKINLESFSKKQKTKKDSSSSHRKEDSEGPMPPRPPTPSGAPPPPPPPPPPPNPAESTQEGGVLGKKRPGGGSDRAPKQPRPDVIIAHDVRRPPEQIMPHIPKVWNPRLQTSPHRPIQETDSVLEPRVAVGLAQVFFMPKDLEHVRKKPTVQVADNAVSLLGQGMQHIKVLMEDLDGKNSQVRALQTQLEQAFNRSNEVAAEANHFRNSAKSLETEKKELLKEKASLEDTVAKRSAEASAAGKLQAAAQEKVLSLEERVKQLEGQVNDLKLAKKSEYDLGMSEALEQIAEQLPIIKDKCRRSGWFLALEAAHVDPSENDLNRGPPSDVSSDEDEFQTMEEGEPSGSKVHEQMVMEETNRANPKSDAIPEVEASVADIPAANPADPLSATFIDQMIQDLS